MPPNLPAVALFLSSRRRHPRCYRDWSSDVCSSDLVLARGGVDADDPQAAEVTLLAAPAHERVLERGVDRLFRGAIQLALVGVVTLRQAQQLLPRSEERRVGNRFRCGWAPEHAYAR